MDNEVEIHNITTSTNTHDLVKNNITAVYILQGVSSVNYTGSLKDYFIIGSRVNGDIPHAKYYSILRAGHSGQILFRTTSTPISLQNIWSGSTPVYSHDGLNADSQYYRSLFRSNTSWRHDFSDADNSYHEWPWFTTPMQHMANAYRPDYVRLYNSANTSQYAHDTYYTNTLKRRH